MRQIFLERSQWAGLKWFHLLPNYNRNYWHEHNNERKFHTWTPGLILQISSNRTCSLFIIVASSSLGQLLLPICMMTRLKVGIRFPYFGRRSSILSPELNRVKMLCSSRRLSKYFPWLSASTKVVMLSVECFKGIWWLREIAATFIS